MFYSSQNQKVLLLKWQDTFKIPSSYITKYCSLSSAIAANVEALYIKFNMIKANKTI